VLQLCMMMLGLEYEERRIAALVVDLNPSFFLLVVCRLCVGGIESRNTNKRENERDAAPRRIQIDCYLLLVASKV